MAVIVESCGDKRANEGKWPPGFRFHPTDEELVLYYLKRKMSRKRLRPDIIRETDVYKWDPEDLPAQSILKTGDRQWFFFSPRDRKYPNGARSNRATGHGYWKATGKDRNVTCNSRNVGTKKTLVFYRGRAPSGERTDWVMHEYTMDEEELRRCLNIQDYYALYKVYKKSGPGPKNGEQYGAPFNEEDWADDDVAVVNIPVTPDISVKQLNEVVIVDKITVSAQPEPLVDDLDEILKHIDDEPAFDQLQSNPYTYTSDQVAGDEHTQSTLVDLSAKTVKEMTSTGLQYDLPAGPAFNQSASSNIQSHEASEVTSTLNNSEPVTQFTDEDFLEMDDLVGPAPVLSTNVEQPVEYFQFDNFDGLSELDLYQDAAMFWHDMGPADHEKVSHSFANTFGDEVANQVGYQFQQNSVNQLDYHFQQNSVTDQVDYQFQQHYMANQTDEHLQHNQLENQVDFQCQNPSMVNELDYQFQSNPVAHLPFGADHMSNQLWVQDQRTNGLTCPESNDEKYSEVSTGIVHGSVNDPTAVDANQNGKEGDSTDGGWFSSALWNFVESIPTSPASASENPLVNKAFQRMSSFSRLRMNAKLAHINTANAAVNVRKVGRNRTFIFISVFGGLCALLWVLVGAVKSVGDIKLLLNM